jgi:hypothetical protein
MSVLRPNAFGSYPRRLPDYNIKRLQRFERPYFSPRRDSYEIDYCVGTDGVNVRRYLFCININTRYLLVGPLDLNENNTLKITQDLLDEMNLELINKFGVGRIMKHIRGDADKTFATIKKSQTGGSIPLGEYVYTQNVLSEFLLALGTDLYINASPYVNKSRVVDRAIRTIRDKIGDQRLFLNKDIMKICVDEYNHTPHSAFDNEFTPIDVQSDPEIEDYFIRQNLNKLEEVREIQRKAGLLKYQPENVLRIYFPRGKTAEKYNKRRYNFDTLAEFIRYDNGNVVCEPFVFNKAGTHIILQNPITIPIYYTKYLCEDTASVPYEYRNAFSN